MVPILHYDFILLALLLAIVNDIEFLNSKFVNLRMGGRYTSQYEATLRWKDDLWGNLPKPRRKVFNSFLINTSFFFYLVSTVGYRNLLYQKAELRGETQILN